MITLDPDFIRKAAQIRFLAKVKEKCSRSNSVFMLTIAYWCGLHIKRIDSWHFKPRLIKECKKENIPLPTLERGLHPHFSTLLEFRKVKENHEEKFLKLKNEKLV